MIKKYLFGVVLALSAICSNAATYYFSDCQTGANAACVAGDDTRTATQAQDPTTPWRTWAAMPAANKVGNTNIRFARGGRWTGVSIGLGFFTASVSRTNEENPMVFEAYTPSWCVNECVNTKPVLYNNTAGAYVFNANDGSNLLDGGYILRDIKLDGGGMPGLSPIKGSDRGIFLYSTVKGVTIERMEITGFTQGIQMSNNNGQQTSRVIIRNSYLHHNLAASILGGADDLLIENNIFSNNGSPDAVPDDHDVYLSHIENGIFRGNTISDTTLDPSTGKCAKTVFVIHGRVKGLLIEDNHILQQKARGTCYGIEADSGYTAVTGPEIMERVIIRDNEIVNVGAAGVVVGSCVDCIIETNRIIWNTPDGYCLVGISTFGGTAPGPEDASNNRNTIRNNSVYMDCFAGSGAFVKGIEVKNTGSGHVVSNNIVFFGPNTVSNTSRTCFNWDTAGSLSSFTFTGKNICYYTNGTPTWSNLHSTLSAAQSAGWDVGSLNTDPLFLTNPGAGNNYSLSLQSTSPAINSGNQTYKSRLSATRKYPIGNRDIGAFDYSASVTAPIAPMVLKN